LYRIESHCEQSVYQKATAIIDRGTLTAVRRPTQHSAPQWDCKMRISFRAEWSWMAMVDVDDISSSRLADSWPKSIGLVWLLCANIIIIQVYFRPKSILSVKWRHIHWPSFGKGENKGSVLLWYSWFDRSILMFLMREGLGYQYIETLSGPINQLTFVFPFAETRSIKQMWRQLTERTTRKNLLYTVTKYILIAFARWRLCIFGLYGATQMLHCYYYWFIIIIIIIIIIKKKENRCLGLVSFCACFRVFFLTSTSLLVTHIVSYFLCTVWLFFSLVAYSHYQRNRLAGKTRPQNDLLCVEWDVKLYSLVFTVNISKSCAILHSSL